MKHLLISLSLGGLLLLAGCQTVQTTQPGTVGVTREQRVSPLVNRNELTQQATLQYKEVLDEASKKQALNRDPALTARVRRIADRIIPQVTVFRPDAAQWKWEVNVLSSNEVNAWCMPGGKIAVYTGLIQKLALTDDELAAVIGHEIAHALREHAWERASQQVNANALLTIGGIIAGASGAQMDMAGMASQVMFELPNSREQETEADRVGIELSARAGYNPDAAVTLWQKMGQQAGGGGTPAWLSTHPPGASRQADLRVYADRVRPLYERARR